MEPIGRNERVRENNHFIGNPTYATNSRAKRKRENQDFFEENVLLHLCRSRNWVEVIRRCHTHPYEAIPIPLNKDDQQKKRHFNCRTKSVEQENSETLYYETALGMVCGSNALETLEMKGIVMELIKVCPSQVQCSQNMPGHTPLRDAILNPKCTPCILHILLQADDSMAKSSKDSSEPAADKKDSNGLCPIDHLILSVQSSDPFSQASNLIKTFVSARPTQYKQSRENSTSPLIRLLSINTSSGIKARALYRNPLNRTEFGDSARLGRILDVSRCLLDQNPNLLYECSTFSGCSPLHIALRNFGNFLPLIKEFSLRDTSNRLVATANTNGDLPVHVASAVGSPFETLQFIVERTLATSATKQLNIPNLLWAKNGVGYTPLDLEWIRYIEGSARTTYPADLSGVGNYFFKPSEYYQNLLRKTVDEIVAEFAGTARHFTMKEKYDKASATFGNLLERLSLFISTPFLEKEIPNDSGQMMLHDACKLCNPSGPCLPLPLLELILIIRHNELLTTDKDGNIPIHYALQTVKGDDQLSLKQMKEWGAFCLKLLQKAPDSSKVVDCKARLPLHLLLQGTESTAGPDDLVEEWTCLKRELLEALFRAFPEGIDRREPISKLDPFMMAATNDTNLPLESVFFLLRQSPMLCYDSNRKED